jgi:hypothetical protein
VATARTKFTRIIGCSVAYLNVFRLAVEKEKHIAFMNDQISLYHLLVEIDVE